jgi:hypothetical protein
LHLWTENGVIVDWPPPQAGRRRPPRRPRTSGGRWPTREGQREAPTRGLEGLLPLPSLRQHAERRPWQQEQRVSAPLPQKRKSTEGVCAGPLLPLPGPLPDLPCAGRQKPIRVAAGSGTQPVRHCVWQLAANASQRKRTDTTVGPARERRKSNRRRTEPVETPTPGQVSCSCPVQKRKNFVSRARATPLRCVALSRPNPKEPNYAVPRRAAPTGWTALRVPLGPPPVRQSWGRACRPPGGRRAEPPLPALPPPSHGRRRATRRVSANPRCRSSSGSLQDTVGLLSWHPRPPVRRTPVSF